MRLLSRMSVPVALLAVAIAGPAVASADSGQGTYQAPEHVYLDGNTAGANTIAGFVRHADGSLSALPRSPFAAGGAGLGAGLSSQDAVKFAHNGRYLLAVDAGSNQISVLSVGRDGSLTPVTGSPFSSGGVEPNSIAVHDGLVYVSNLGSATAAPNYTGFTLTPWGQLHPIPNSTVTLPAGENTGDIVLNNNATKLVGAVIGGTTPGSSLLNSYRVNWDGTLAAAPGSPFEAQGLGAFGSEFSPINPHQVFVSNAHNGAGLGTVSAFDDSWNGTLSSIGTSPFADQQTAPCWIFISHNGRRLYALNTGTGSVSTYSIVNDGTLTLRASTPLSNPVGAITGTDVTISDNDNTLYVNEAKNGTVGAFKINPDGTVRQLPGSPYATGFGTGSTTIGVADN
ncbi:MAG: beta-propeller fold lactonase family protein [Solirubrobacteraceae bacterium]